MSIICGDCLEEMKKFPDNHFSAIITDPPYGLKFMNKKWDYELPSKEYWKECLRVSKPGGYLLAMGGTRTFHRLACAIEDAGYEIRDCLMWIYGSGFPKSHNKFGCEGYGTALKPAYEPIIMAMKPCDGTYKQNAEKWGQAGINIDDCRIGTDDTRARSSKNALGILNDDNWKCKEMIVGSEKGRWPANVMFDEEAAEMLDDQSGYTKSPSNKCYAVNVDSILKDSKGLHTTGRKIEWQGKADSGGASRFFYCAKAAKSERGSNNKHPTVKPLKLMEYLIKLVMPPKDGLLLDPFAGSGTTILAAYKIGLNAIGIEKNVEYVEIAKSRLEKYIAEVRE